MRRRDLTRIRRNVTEELDAALFYLQALDKVSPNKQKVFLLLAKAKIKHAGQLFSLVDGSMPPEGRDARTWLLKAHWREAALLRFYTLQAEKVKFEPMRRLAKQFSKNQALYIRKLEKLRKPRKL